MRTLAARRRSAVSTLCARAVEAAAPGVVETLVGLILDEAVEALVQESVEGRLVALDLDPPDLPVSAAVGVLVNRFGRKHKRPSALTVAAGRENGCSSAKRIGMQLAAVGACVVGVWLSRLEINHGDRAIVAVD